MPAAVSVGLLVLLLGIIGGGARQLIGDPAESGDDPGGRISRFEDAFLLFLTGLAVASGLLMLLALLDAFSIGAIAAAATLIVSAAVGRLGQRPGVNGARVRGCLVGLLGIAVAASVAYGIAPPYEARLNGSDASVYLGMAAHIARTGGLGGEDPLVAEMTVEERRTLFSNRFPRDVTGTDGPVARLRFAQRLPRRFRLELDIVDVYPPNRGRPLTARVGNDIREVRLPHNPDTVGLTFESRAPGNTIELHIPQPTSPASRGESRDMRLLGIRVKMLRVVELPE